MVEFTTLCDVNACMIIYPPKQDTGASIEPEIWPENPEEVRRIIEIYKSKTRESGNKTFGLTDFFKDRKKKVEDDLAKLKRKNLEAKYPTKIDFINGIPESDLRIFAAKLMEKLEYVKSRIEFLRSQEPSSLMDMSFAHFYNSVSGFDPIPTVEMQHNPCMMFLNNFRESGNLQCASIEQYFYESSNCSLVEDMIGHYPNPNPIPAPVQQQYVPILQPVQPSQFVQCTGMVPSFIEQKGEEVQGYISQYLDYSG